MSKYSNPNHPHNRPIDPMENDAARKTAFEKMLDAHRVLGESRMIRTETDPSQVTDEQVQCVIDQVRAYLKERGVTQAQLAKALCIGSSSVSQILKGNYGADPRAIVMAMDRWLERRKSADQAPQTCKFVWTEVAKKIRLAAQRAMAASDAGIDSRISLVWGDPGCGKTLALEAIAESEDAILITCDIDTRSGRNILRKIAEQLRLGNVAWNASESMFSAIVDKLRGSGKLIIVDEIHALLDARDDTPFHTLRRLSDQTGCPQLWAATCDLIGELQKRERKREPLGQIVSRIGSQFHLTAKINQPTVRGGRPEPLFTVEQVLEMYGSNEIKLSRDAARFLARLCTNPKRGLLRTCTGLVAHATKISRVNQGVREMSVEMLWDAACFLFQDSVIASIQAEVRDELQDVKLKLHTA